MKDVEAKVSIAELQRDVKYLGEKILSAIDEVHRRQDITNGRINKLESEQKQHEKEDEEFKSKYLSNQNEKKTQNTLKKAVITGFFVAVGAWAGSGFKTPWN